MYISDLTLNFIAKLRCTLNWTVSARICSKIFPGNGRVENEKQNKRNSRLFQKLFWPTQRKKCAKARAKRQ